MSDTKILDKICRATNQSPEVVRDIAGRVLEELHRIARFDDKGTTAMLMESCWNFGEKAVFHLGGLIAVRDYEIADESFMSETLERFMGCENDQFNAVRDEWKKYYQDIKGIQEES